MSEFEISTKYLVSSSLKVIAFTTFFSAQLAGAVEYTATASLQQSRTPQHTPNECPGYIIKPSDGEAPALEI